ncbi:MAG: metallophosphoesterase [Bdellovibrionaceae bacterium]|nr:metallophosphoesterase [Pseudobdellovibrionaceae bacterium]
MSIQYKFSGVLVCLFFLAGCANSNISAGQSNNDAGTDVEEPTTPDNPSPPEPPQNHVWKVAVISDMNGSYGSTTYSSAVKSAINYIAQDAEVSLVLSTGDMVAGQKTGLDYAKMWSAFRGAVTSPLSAVGLPLLPSPGNHDASVGSSFKKERDMYVKEWNGFPIARFNSSRPSHEQVHFLPHVEQNYPLNFAVTMGEALFVSLDATAVGPLVNDQLGWLEEVLEAGKNYKIKVVFGHVPLYPVAFGKASEYIALGTAKNGYSKRMEDILEAYGVTYYLSGHSHVFYPGHRNGSVKYISVPLLGSGARKVLTKDRTGSTSKTGFLYLTFNSQGEHHLEAVESPSFKAIPFSSVPSAVSVPSATASDCQGCGTFPSEFFLSKSLRTLFLRLTQ